MRTMQILLAGLVAASLSVTAAAQQGADESGAVQDSADESAANDESQVSDAEEFVELDGEPERCISVRRIRRTEIIDDRTIAFFMRNRDVYVNTLPRRCPQLASEDRFSYEARGGRLCSIDYITVLQQFGGRLDSGFTCRLGAFVPVDEETVEIMIAAAESGGTVPPARGEAVEVPEEDEDGAEEEPADEASAAQQ